MYEQPKTIDEAKNLVASPAGVEFEKYPLKFATPAYFGARPQPGTPVTVNSGSASLLRLNGQPAVRRGSPRHATTTSSANSKLSIGFPVASIQSQVLFAG